MSVPFRGYPTRAGGLLTAAACLGLLALPGCAKKGTAADTTPPAPPSGVSATRGDGAVTLEWTVVSASDLQGYYPWHQPSGSAAVKGTLVPATSPRNALITGLTNGVAHEFWVTSVDDSDNESAPSIKVTATPNSAFAVTALGWVSWEAADYVTARSLFEDALNFDGNYADARNGLGWTSLKEGNLTQAGTFFDGAIADGLTAQDARVGGLTVYKEIAGQIVKAAGLGSAALAADPTYVFAHDATVNAALVRVMLAQAHFRVGAGSFPAAQALMDLSVPGNGLDPGTPGTWTVDGTPYPTYAGALLALIEFAYSLL